MSSPGIPKKGQKKEPDRNFMKMNLNVRWVVPAWQEFCFFHYQLQAWGCG
jgi:hypothetical protein